ncbi:hypothetical protein GUJ93_ZPchr0009g1627 [Zizania palustris]|uniref:Protein WEAK CHLOROPLAST MOVEMENT UNDER BLUE LIGHT 1-like n=1 Tax=Zizania palustris TaxID=103762 RepID=A0A8J5UYC5_ZIZPA|nr:hypothetical protein GUJ93_ZPchr0009g1627 [Zizania palustris]
MQVSLSPFNSNLNFLSLYQGTLEGTGERDSNEVPISDNHLKLPFSINLLHTCQEMEGLNTEDMPKVSVAPDSLDTLASSADSKTPTPVDLPASTKPFGHIRHSSEDLSSLIINDSRIRNGDKNHHNQFEHKGRNHIRHSSEDLSSLAANDYLCANKVDDSRHNSAERNIFRAAEIAQRFIRTIDNRVVVDTAAPIESVKDAVSKFGGILDWKERRKHVQEELDKVQDDAPKYKRRVEAMEFEKCRVLEELCGARRAVEDIKIRLEKAQIEAVQAQQDLELAEIRFKEMKHGIAQKESATVKAEISLVNERREAVLTELQSARTELDQLEKEYKSLVSQRDVAERRARESTAISQETDKTVEDLTIKIITMKQLLISSHASHIIAEEQKRNASSSYQREKASWKDELNRIDGQVQKLNDDLSANKDLESKLRVASESLASLKDQHEAYLQVTLAENDDHVPSEPMIIVRVKLARTRKELEDMRINIEKAKDEVKALWIAAATLRASAEEEKTNLVALRQKEHLALASASSLQEELDKTAFELTVVEERTKAAKMPLELQEASKEAEHAKTKARLAREEMEKAGEEVEQAKADMNVVQLRLEAASREILATNASKDIAVASANALQDYKQEELELGPPQITPRSASSLTLSLDEYNVLIKKVQDAENLAKHKVIKAVEKIKEAKDGEASSLERLDQLTKQIDDKRVALRHAQKKANAAHDGKLAMEDELRKRRAKHDKERKTSEASPVSEIFSNVKNTSPSSDAALVPRVDTTVKTTLTELKPRRSFFPRAIATLFLSKRKTHLK